MNVRTSLELWLTFRLFWSATSGGTPTGLPSASVVPPPTEPVHSTSPSSLICCRLPFVACGQVSRSAVRTASVDALFVIVILTCLSLTSNFVTESWAPVLGHGFAGELCSCDSFGTTVQVLG